MGNRLLIVARFWTDFSKHDMLERVFFLFALLVCGVFAQPSVPCSKSQNGERYFVSDKVQCDKFHMCDETGKLAAEFLCEDGLIFEAPSACYRSKAPALLMVELNCRNLSPLVTAPDKMGSGLWRILATNTLTVHMGLKDSLHVKIISS